MDYQIILLIVFAGAIFLINRLLFNIKRKRRRNYYRNEYLKSDEIEIFFKAYSMKDFFDKKNIEKFNLTKVKLSSTNWFRGEFSKIIKMN